MTGLPSVVRRESKSRIAWPAAAESVAIISLRIFGEGKASNR